MKPFLLIVGCYYYPGAGTEDWRGCFETYEEARNNIIEEVKEIQYGTKKHPKKEILKYYQIKDDNNNCRYDWYEIIDLREWMGIIDSDKDLK